MLLQNTFAHLMPISPSHRQKFHQDGSNNCYGDDFFVRGPVRSLLHPKTQLSGGHKVRVLRDRAGSKQGALEKFHPTSASPPPTAEHPRLWQLYEHFEGEDEEKVEPAQRLGVGDTDTPIPLAALLPT